MQVAETCVNQTFQSQPYSRMGNSMHNAEEEAWCRCVYDSAHVHELIGFVRPKDLGSR